MNITPLCQRDPRWAKEKIGQSNSTLYDFGCTITALCMALERLRGIPASPSDAAKFWKFTSDGKILWQFTKFKGMKFVWRGYMPDYQSVKEFTDNPKKAAIIQVKFGKNFDKIHWVFLEKVEGEKILHIIDPIDGKRYANLPKKYRFSGYALFEAAPIR